MTNMMKSSLCRRMLFPMLALFLLAGGYAQAAKPKAWTDLKVPALEWKMPEYQSFNLPNGIAGFCVEDREVPIVDFSIQFTSPSDPADKAGLADITTWTLRQGGSTNIPADSLNDLLEFGASNLSISAGSASMSIWGNCLTSELETVLGLVQELIDHPAYPQEKLDLRRGTLLEQIRRKNDQPEDIALAEFNRIMFSDHPWGWEPRVVTVNAVTRDDLVAYHRLVFRSRGAVIGFSGDIDAGRASELSARFLGHLKPGDAEIGKLPPVPPPPQPGVYFASKAVSQAYIFVGHRSIRYDDPRRVAAEMMNYILGGGGFTSILTKRIRVDAGLSYSVWSRFTTPHEDEGYFRAGASTRTEQSGQTLSLMIETIRKFAETGPTEEEFDKARKAYVNSYVWRFDSSSEILNRLVYLKWRGLPLDTPQRDLAAYQRLTRADVQNAARELIHSDRLMIVVVGDKSKMDRPLEDFGTVTEISLTRE
ncbi:MAG: insulinase family protein [Calditrichaeota bacterium]|nr:insulinase family protein [Calditrichota bacterium]